MKKGTWIMGDALYWLVYISITAAVLLGMIIIPESIMNSMVQPISLDAQIMEQRLFNKVALFDPVLGLRSNYVESDIRRAAALSISEKRFAYKISTNPVSSQFIANKDFYDVAYPLAPIKYHRFISSKKMILNNEEVVVVVDQVYPKKYDI